MGVRRTAVTTTAATAVALTLAAAGPITPVVAVPLHVAATKASAKPGSAGCNPSSDPSPGVDVDGTLYFSADDGVHGRELWKSDGTRKGTVMVKEIVPGPRNTNRFSHLVAAGDRLFFLTDDGVHGQEVWTSDGTSAGTVLVKDVGVGRRYGASPQSLHVAGDTVYFAANDGVHGHELWRSDGTPDGTAMVKDIGPGENRSGPWILATSGDTVYFAASDGVHGRELWKTAGTEAGTGLVADLTPGRAGTFIRNSAAVVDGTLFFEGDAAGGGHDLWKSDGAESGTVLVRHFDRVPDDDYDYGPDDLTAAGDTLYFTANDGVHGRELWTSDGTEVGTAMVADVASDSGYYSEHYGPTYFGPRSLRAVGDTVFMTIDDDVHSGELWRSDGTAAGTVMVDDIRPGVGASAPGPVTAVEDEVFFSATDGVHGREVWTSDGTASGTALLRDVDPDTSDYYSGPDWVTASGGRVFFAEYDGAHGTELWRTDGTTAGTVRVRDIATDYRFDVLGFDQEHPRSPRVRLYTNATGDLRIQPLAGSKVRADTIVLSYGGATSVGLNLTRPGLRQLRRTGSLRITVRLTFTPCAGESVSEVRTFRISSR